MMTQQRWILAVALILITQVRGVAAGPVISESVVTGADMVGIEVEAFYNGISETAIWDVTSADGSVPDGEGFAGAASGSGWSLAQQGFTFGNLSNTGSLLGLWTFSNFTNFMVTGFQVCLLYTSDAADDLPRVELG